MFRWTAGTKARADRAARLHNISGGPGRLLLASRPLHTGLQPDTNPPALSGQFQAVVAAVPKPPVRSPAPTRDESVLPACEGANCGAETHDATPPLEEKRAVSADVGVFTGATISAPAARDSSTPTARVASVPSTASVDLLGCTSAVGPTDTSALVHPSASAATPPSSLQAATTNVPRLPPAAGCTAVSLPSASSVSLHHADQLVRAAATAAAAAGTAAVAQRRTKRQRDHDQQRHHQHDRSQSGSCGDRTRHKLERCTNWGGGKVCGDSWGTTNSSDTPRSYLSDRMRDTYGPVQQRLLDDHRYSSSEHSSRGQARHRRRSPQHGHAAARPSPPPPPPPPPVLRPVVSVDCVLVQQPLHGPPSQALRTATSSTVSYRPSYQNGRQAYGVSRNTTRAHSSVAGTAAAAATTGGGAVPDAHQCQPPLFSTPQWGEAEATATMSEDMTMVTVAADAYHDEVGHTSPPRVPVDATLFQEPEASHGFPFASPTCWEGRAEEGRRRSAWAAETSLRPPPHQPCPSLMTVDVEDRPFAWGPPQPSSLFDDPPSRMEASGADSGMWLLPPPLPLARSTKEEELTWVADSSFFAAPPRRGGSALFPSAEAAWGAPRPPSPPTGGPSTAAAAPPWQRGGQWEEEKEESDNTALTYAAGAPFPHEHDAPLWFPWCASPPVDAWGRGGEGGWTEQTSTAAPVLPSQHVALLPSVPHDTEMRLHPPWQPLPHGPPSHRQMSAVQPVPHTVRRVPEVGTHAAAAAMQRGGSGGGEGGQRGRQRQRQPPARALTGTTERCRRFWERCRHAPDIKPPRSSGFY